VITIEAIDAIQHELNKRPGDPDAEVMGEILMLAKVGMSVIQGGNEDLESHIVRWVAREHMMGFRAGHYYRGEKCKCGSTNTG
jgi:hypothetical protein